MLARPFFQKFFHLFLHLTNRRFIAEVRALLSDRATVHWGHFEKVLKKF